MFKAELLVELKIPDTTAITAYNTLVRMGYNKLEKLARKDYYRFWVKRSHREEFEKKIRDVDVIINVNKHSYELLFEKKKKEESDSYSVSILVKDIDDSCQSLLNTLTQRLGLDYIKKLEKGVLWVLSIKADSDSAAEAYGKIIAKELLYNPHYQSADIYAHS